MKALLISASAMLAIALLGCDASDTKNGAPTTTGEQITVKKDERQKYDSNWPQPKEVPEGTVGELYADEVFLVIRNSVSADTLQRFASCFTPELVRHFASHYENVSRWMEENAGETLKLPASEGPIFISNYEGADTYSVGKGEINGTYADVPVSLSYSEGEDKIRWVDVVKLRLINGAWLVDDIQFDPERWDFHTLRKRLALDE